MILKFKSLIPFLLASILALSTQSCFDGDDYDMDKLSEQVDWTPNMIVPAGYGTYTLWYLLNQHEADPADQTIVLDAEGFLHIKYLEEDIFTYNVADVLDFPAQSALNLSYSLPSFGVGIDYGLLPTFSPQTDQIQITTGGSTAITLYELDLNANLRFLISNPLNKFVDLSVSIPNGTVGGAAINEVFNLDPNLPNQEKILNLADLNLLFNTPYTTNNDIDIVFNITVIDDGGLVTSSGDLGINLEVQNIDFQLAQGDFGNQSILLDAGNIDMDVDFWDDIEGDYQFANPQISLQMENSVGVPFQINADIIGYASDGTSAALNPDALQPNYPNAVSATNPLAIDAITEIITYDKNNSDIVDLMALPPSDRLEYMGDITLNPVGAIAPTPTTPNLISNNSAIGVDIEIDIPLDFTANKLMLRDTIEDLDISDADKIMNAAVVIVTENGYPLDVMIDKIYFTDAAYNIIDEITDNEVIDAATVFTTGANIGEVDPSSIKEVEHQIKLTQTQIENLNKTENLIINASVSTSNGGVPVKLKGDYELKFTLSVQAQIDLNN
jgi:rRNA maturation endonuclease Nob1